MPAPFQNANVRFGSNADMCSAQASVRYGPIVDIATMGAARPQLAQALFAAQCGRGPRHRQRRSR